MPAKKVKEKPIPPEPGQIWEDAGGLKLEVVAIANEESIFPLSVVGKDDHNNFWSYPLNDWERMFKFIEKAAMTFEQYKKEAEEFVLKPLSERVGGREIIPEFELRLIEEKTVWRQNR